MMPRTPTTGSQGSPESDSGRTGRSADTADSSAWIRRLGRNLSPVSLHGRINISAFFEASGPLTVTAATDVPDVTSTSKSRPSESVTQIKPEAEALALSVRCVLQDAWSDTDEDSQKLFNENMPEFPSDGRSLPDCFWLWDLQGTHSVAGWVGLDKDGPSVNVSLPKENLGPPEQFGHPGFTSIQTVIGCMGGPIGNHVRARLDMPQPLKLGSRHFVIKSCEMGSMVVNEAKQLVLFVGFRPASAAEVENFLIA